MWDDLPWAKTGVCAGQRPFGSLRRCATPRSTAHSTPGGPDRSGRLWGETGEPVQSPAAPGEDVSGELGAGRKVAEKLRWCLGLYSQQRVKN